VIGAEIVSRFVNWEDRRTCVLFGDGAGAVVLQATDRATGILSYSMGTKGEDYDALIYRGAGCVHPIGDEPMDEGLRYLQMDGRRILNFAVRRVGPAVRKQLRLNGLSKDDIALVIPQQSNLRFIEWIADKLGFPRDRVFVNVDRYANTSSASVAIALCEALEEGRIRQGDNVVLLSFGSGLNWAATLLRYGEAEGTAPVVVHTPSRHWIVLDQVREKVGSLAQTAGAGVVSVLNLALLPFLSFGKKE
jgi:3-oxoacyl-[acyl-carrier-protein] synthase-3